MKPTTTNRLAKKNGYQSDDDNIRYKINTQFVNNNRKASPKKDTVKKDKVIDEDNDVRYKFPTVSSKLKQEQKPKSKPKIKVNFWSNKQSSKKLGKSDTNKQTTNRRHTVGGLIQEQSDLKQKNTTVKVRKRVSFLPSPLFSENHVPMVTVPDDLTIQLNEDEANDLGEDLNEAFVNSSNNDKSNYPKKKSRASLPQTSPRGSKRKQISDDSHYQVHGNENELEFFSKYVVQKLRRMETNQRIYSENLINTVLMLGQLSKLHGKSKIADA